MKINKSTFLLVAVFAVLTVYLISTGAKEEVLPIGSKLPELEYKTREGEKEKIKQIDKPLVLVYFSSDCPHCTYELELIDKNIDSLQQADFLLITTEKGYFEKEHISNYANPEKDKSLKFGTADKKEFDLMFGINPKPTLFFFSRDGILTDKVKGEVKLKKLQELINKSEAPELRADGKK